MERAADFEFTVTESGAEVLLLENLFIKRHKPRYNALLKDDKTYLLLHQDRPHEDFPQVYITKRFKHEGVRYFDPFASAGLVRKTLDLPDPSQRMLA
jgi:excinuclease ABC subunit C